MKTNKGSRLVHVTQSDIDTGKRCEGKSCMVALAVRRALSLSELDFVYTSYGSEGAFCLAHGAHYVMGQRCHDAMERFDGKKPIKPFAFFLKPASEND